MTGQEDKKPTDADVVKLLALAEQEAGVASVLAIYDRAESIYAAVAQHFSEPYGYASNSTAGGQNQRPR